LLNTVGIARPNHNLAEALEWVRQLPQAEEVQTGLVTLAYEAIRTERLQSLRMATELPANETRDNLIHRATREWRPRIRPPRFNGLRASKIPRCASRFFPRSPPRGLKQIRSPRPPSWTEKDAGQAGECLNQLTVTSGKDAAVAAYVEKLAVLHPEIAAEWVREIRNDSLRNQRMENLGELWLLADEAAARQGLPRPPCLNSPRPAFWRSNPAEVTQEGPCSNRGASQRAECNSGLLHRWVGRLPANWAALVWVQEICQSAGEATGGRALFLHQRRGTTFIFYPDRRRLRERNQRLPRS
jgi:hypothetical protein